MNLQNHNKIPIIRMVLLTSLPSYILAEVFFGILYFGVVSAVYWLQYLFSIGITENIEANMDIFSPINIIIFFIGMTLISIIMCMEILTIIAITTYDYYRNDHIPLKSLVAYAFEKMRWFLRFRSFPFFLFIFLFPKVQIAPTSLIALNIPPFIIDEILKFPLYLVLIFIVGIIILYGIYRSLFVLHFLFLERNTVSRAFSESFHLTKKLWFRKIFFILFRNIFWTFLFILPIIAFGIAFSRIITMIEPIFGNGIWILSDAINAGMEFLFLGLTGSLFLAGLTIAYIRHSGYQKKHFESRFHFLKNQPKFTPRWKNVRLFLSKKYVIFVSFLLIIFTPLFLSIIIQPETKNISNPIVISHRGVSDGDYIENTISGIIEAKNQWANIIEIDVYENKDGTLVLSHDKNLKRVAGIDKKISDLTNADLENIRLPNGEKIPTLDAVMETARMYNMELLIEPKIHGEEKNLLHSLVATIEKYDMVERVKIHSFNKEMLKNIKKMQPHLDVGLIIFGGLGRFGATEVDFFSLQERMVTRSVINNIHQFEKKIYIWTLNDASKIGYYMRMGVDGIITDSVPEVQNKISSVLETSSQSPQTVFRIFGNEISVNDFILFWKELFSSETEKIS